MVLLYNLLGACSIFFLLACGGEATPGLPSRTPNNNDLALDTPRSEVPKASDLVRRGEQHLAANEPDAAQPLFEQAIKENPNDQRAFLDLGITKEMLGDIDGAENEYRRAIAIQDDFAEALNNLGVILRVKRSLDESITTLRRATTANRESAAGHMNLALALEDNGEYEQAVAEYRTTLRLNPDDVITRANYGLLLLKTGKKEAAERELKRALENAVGNRAALLAIGNGLRRIGETQKAVEAIEAAINADGGKATPALLSELALAKRANGERQSAIVLLRKVIEMDENYAIAHYLLANMLAAKTEYAEAKEHYNTYLKLEPESTQANRARERLRIIQSISK